MGKAYTAVAHSSMIVAERKRRRAESAERPAVSCEPNVESCVWTAASQVQRSSTQGKLTHPNWPGGNQCPESHRCRNASPHDRLHRHEREVLGEDRLVDVVDEGALATQAPLCRPELSRVDRDANGRRHDAEPCLEVRFGVAGEACWVVRREGEGRAPGLGGCLADVGLVLDNEVLEE